MGHDLTAMHTGARPDVKDVIGLAYRFFIVFDHDHRVALIAEVLERQKQPVIVALMQTNGGLVQNVKNTGQAGPDLAGQTDTLAFTARQGAGVSAERQVLQTDVVQETKPLADFLENGAGNLILLVRKVVRRILDPGQRLANGLLDHLPDVDV